MHRIVKDRQRLRVKNASGSLAEGLLGGREVLFGVGQAAIVGGQKGDFGE
ncbi:hypothetical protein SBA3_3800026 [Candidatus Sulfopaludibacter sp. SbA3]|nr:hypothetical protein SBA3_3800026 [Candidatus Sulfopaludibacter sp. SbA3]